MRSQLNLSLFNGRFGLLFYLFAFGLGLAGCQTNTTQTADSTPPADEQPVPSPCEGLSLQKLELRAIELLDQGESEPAHAILECTLEQHPNSRKAKTLREQLDADPVSYLGRRNYPYTVQSSDTLSKIAQDRLGSPLKFVILARYNGIAVPANLVAGQTIKIPGEESEYQAGEQPQESVTVPVPVPTEPPPSEPTEVIPAGTAGEFRDQAVARENAGDLEQAYALVSKAKDADPSLENIDDDYSRIKNALITELEEKAYSLEFSGSKEEALANWERILEIDPRNIQAQLSRSRLTTQ